MQAHPSQDLVLLHIVYDIHNHEWVAAQGSYTPVYDIHNHEWVAAQGSYTPILCWEYVRGLGLCF